MLWALSQYGLVNGIHMLCMIAPHALVSLCNQHNGVTSDMRTLQHSAPILVGMGRRQLQQDSFLHPNYTSSPSFTGASAPVDDGAVAGFPQAALPQSPSVAAAPEIETALAPLSTDLPEELELGAPTESPLEAQPEADLPSASEPTASIPAKPATHTVLSPAGVASHEIGEAVVDNPPAVDDPVTGTADLAMPPSVDDLNDRAVGVDVPPAVDDYDPEPPAPGTLMDSVFSNQAHEKHLRISVVVIIASLLLICGFAALLLFVSKRWFADPEEDDYPLSPRGSYFILKSRPGKQDLCVGSHWHILPTMSRDSLQGTMKNTLKKSLNHSLSVPRSSLAGGSARRTSNWGAGGIPATHGYTQTFPSAGDALYTTNAGWGWSSGGRELGRDLYRSMSDSGAKLEEDPNVNTWPPAMSRVTRVLSVLPEGTEEEERRMSTMSRQSQMLRLSTFRRSPAPLNTAAMAAHLESGITARRCSDPFPLHEPGVTSSRTPQHVACHTVDDPVGGQLPGSELMMSAGGKPSTLAGHANSGQGPGAAPVLARICELGRMASSEMTVVVDKNVRASADDCAEGLRYTGSPHVNQHSPANKGACDAPWKDEKSSHARNSGGGGSRGQGTSLSMRDDGASRPGSWHSMHSGISRDGATSGTPRSEPTIIHATEAEDLGLKDHAQYRQASHYADTSKTSQRQDCAWGSRAQARPRTISPASDNAFDRLFSGPAPAAPLEAAPGSSKQLEAVCSLGAGSSISAHAAPGPGFAEEDMSHPPEPSAEPAGLPEGSSIHNTQIIRANLGPSASATAVVPRRAFVRNCTTPAASGVREKQKQRLQSISLPREKPTRQMCAEAGAAYQVAERTESAGTQSSYDVEAIAKQVAAAWRAGRAADGGSAHANKSVSVAQNGGRSGGSVARRLGLEVSGNTHSRSSRTLRHLPSMATSVHIRNSLALREQRVVHASRDPVCFSRRSRRRSHVGNSHTASALRNVIASTGGTPVLPDDAIQVATPTPLNRSISPRFRNSVAAITGTDKLSGAPAGAAYVAPFPSVPVSDYALTWLSKVRMSDGDSQQQPLTQRTTDSALAARGVESSTEHDRDNSTPSALPSAGHSCSSGSAYADVKGSQRFWGSSHKGGSGRHGNTDPAHPAHAFGSSHLSPHRGVPTDSRLKRTASFGCQVEPQMMSCEMAAIRNVDGDMGRSVAGSLSSTAVPSMLGSSAAASPMERSSHAPLPTLSSQFSQPPRPPPPAPSNASNKNSLHEATGFSGFSAMTDPRNESAFSSTTVSPTGTNAAIPRRHSDVRAPWPSMSNPLFGAGSNLGNPSTVYSSVRSDTLATESGMHEDKDAVGVTERNSLLHKQASIEEDRQHGEDTPAVVIPEEEALSSQLGGSDTLPLLPTDGRCRNSSDSRHGSSGEGGPPKIAVKSSIDSVRTSYGFVALGALAERYLRTSGDSLRGIRQAIQKVSHSHEGSIASELHRHATRDPRESLEHTPSLAGFDACSSVSPTVAARTLTPGRSVDLSGPVSAKSGRSVTLALLPDACRSSAAESIGRATDATSPVAVGVMPNSSIPRACSATSNLGSTGKECQMSSPAVLPDQAAAVQRSAPCLSLQLLSPSPSPETQLSGLQLTGGDSSNTEGRRRKTS